MKNLILAISLMVTLAACGGSAKEVETTKSDSTCVDSVACCTATGLSTGTVATTVTK